MYKVKRFSAAKKEEKSLKNKPKGGLGLATLVGQRSSVRKGANKALKKYESGELTKGEAVKEAKKEGLKKGLVKGAKIGTALGTAIVAGKVGLAKGLTKLPLKDVVKELNPKAVSKSIGKITAGSTVYGGLIARKGAGERTKTTIERVNDSRKITDN